MSSTGAVSVEACAAFANPADQTIIRGEQLDRGVRNCRTRSKEHDAQLVDRDREFRAGYVQRGCRDRRLFAVRNVVRLVFEGELANRDQWEFKPTAPRVIDAREAGDIGWIVTESRWEFEDGSFLPVRGLTVLHREDGVWKYIAGVTAPAIPNELLRPGSPITQAAPVSA